MTNGKFTAIVGGKVITPNVTIPEGIVLIQDSQIRQVGPSENVPIPENAELLDASGKIVCPGFIEIHIHGGYGITLGNVEESLDSPTGTVAGDIRLFADALPAVGITSFIPTFSASSFDVSLRMLAEATKAIDDPGDGAQILGLQMEGPYFNPSPKGPYDRYPASGAQQAEHFRKPSLNELHEMMEVSGGHLKMMCLSPEIDGAVDIIKEMALVGIVASGAHSLASYEETLVAVDAGMRTVTHLYNGMRRQDHREPGIIEASLVCNEISSQIIADGIHVHAPAFEIAYRCKGNERLIITTDNTVYAGMPNGLYKDTAGRELEKTDDYVRIVDSVLAGSVMPMNRQLHTIVHDMGIPLEDAITMASVAPSHLLGLQDRKGSLEPGRDADVLILDDQFVVCTAFCRGILSHVGH
ncbi:MAG: N-acetylglucosamine-6-phosphate deacetylase [Anaerolineales bacterium]|nr:N-acetylglucosamine-6-phosphate deacetylase [Anaerolineales bacterium]